MRRIAHNEVLDSHDINRIVVTINRGQILNARAALATAVSAKNPEWLKENVQAIAKAKAAGDLDESCNCVPNDYYISNVNPKLRTVAVPVSAAISVLDPPGSPEPVSSDLAGLQQYVADYGDSPPPFWISVVSGTVTSIEPQFLP